MIEKENLQYMIGGLLYMPAFQKNIIEKIKNNSIEKLTSICFCLEDSILDISVKRAEDVLLTILKEIKNIKYFIDKDIPLIFIRIRTPEHMYYLSNKLKDMDDILTGYVLPKVDLGNIEEYVEVIKELNENKEKIIYVMPILETEMIADISKRSVVLTQIKQYFDSIKDYILNVRVGGNDFSNLYGVRCTITQTIYDIGVIRDILIDILNVFSREYIVSGPVWNYFGNEKDSNKWKKGLIKELKKDKINGFIGKTAIHPAQLPYIYDSLKVTQIDYKDACQILDWKIHNLGVSKSVDGLRMNEVKTHQKWAERIYKLGQIYGMKDEVKNYESVV